MHKVLFGVILAVFLLSGIFIVRQKNNREGSPEGNAIPQEKRSLVKDTNADCPPIFTKDFTDVNGIDAFQPIGSITGASRGRSYITVKKGVSVPVYAPTGARLVAIIYSYRGADAAAPEYGFKFDTGCGVTFLLDHLDTISDELKPYAPKEPSRSTATNDDLSVQVKAGTLLGYTNGTPQARTFDFLVIDENFTAPLINLSRWKWDQSVHSVCPYDLYQGEQRDKYYEKLGLSTQDGLIKADACGSVSHDIAGTISGGWFATDIATDLEGGFMLVGASLGQVDVAIKTGSEQMSVRITDYRPSVLPNDVGVDKAVCYRGFNNDWVYLKLLTADTISINNGSGDCPGSFPESDAKKYYR